MKEYFSTGDAAKDAALTTMGILQAVRRGDLRPAAKTRGGMNLFRIEEIERFKASRAARSAAKNQDSR